MGQWGKETEGLSRKMYKGLMGKDNEGRIECECGMGRAGESNGRKMRTSVIEQQ